MLYENYETEISQNNLSIVFAEIPEPLCLLGGWAVYLTVNKYFQKAHNGRNYHGSKDIDLGFHMGSIVSEDDLRDSTFNKAIKILENNGFYMIGSRLVQHYHIATKKGLTVEQSKKIPSYDMFDLYVDPIVDRIPSNIKSVLGINPVDEPLLREVFENGKYHTIKAFGAKLMLPNPEVLLVTKLNAVLERQKDHKRTKDIADIYGLIWHSGIKTATLREKLLKIKDEKTITDIISKFTEKDYEDAGKALGVDKEEIANVIKSFIPIRSPDHMASEDKESEKDQRWRIPFNITYEGYVKILKALYHQKADSTSVTLDRLTSVTQMNKNTLGVNLQFLKSIDVVEGDGKIGYKLTPLGFEHAKSHFSENHGLIKSTSKTIIEKSFLRSLLDFIELNKDAKPENLFGFIKAEGRFTEGPGYTGMSSPYGSGARVLIHIFQDAELLPDKISDELKNLEENVRTVKSRIQSKQKVTKLSAPKLKHDVITKTSSELSPDTFGRVTVAGVTTVDITDLDSLELAESALKILRKKVESQQIDGSESEENNDSSIEN